MACFKTYTLSLLLIISCYRIHVEAYLEITREAVRTSERLINEVKNEKTYASLKELNDDLRKLMNLTTPFVDVSETFRSKTKSYNVRYWQDPEFASHLSDYLESLCWIDISYEDHLIKDKTKDEKYSLQILTNLLGERKEDYEPSLVQALGEIYSPLFETQLQADNSSLFDLMFDSKECLSRRSHQQQIFEFLKVVTMRDAEALVLVQYAYAQIKLSLGGLQHLKTDVQRWTAYDEVKRVTNQWEEKDIIKKMKSVEAKFVERNFNILSKVRDANIALRPRNVSVCGEDVLEDKEGVTFTKLDRAFQKYIVNEVDLNEVRTCTDDCPFHKKTKVYGCFDKTSCARQPTCNGKVWDCGPDILSTVHLCPSSDNSSKYDSVRIGHKQFGSTNCQDKAVDLDGWRRGFRRCSYCLCTCENAEPDSDLYFNLQPVKSNVQLNHVITGVRFQKVNHVIHIQIQEGKLLPEGTVNSTEWKPVNKYTIHDRHIVSGIDYHRLSWEDGRTVFLDRLDSPKGQAMTGIRLNLVDGNLRLEIQATPFDFKSGKLTSSSMPWLVNSATLEDRAEVKLNELKLTSGSDKKKIYYFKERAQIYSAGFLRFTTSRMEFDVGQSTIPYFDIEKVETTPAVPTSGAGIFLRNNDEFGPILAMELLTYDFSSHV